MTDSSPGILKPEMAIIRRVWRRQLRMGVLFWTIPWIVGYLSAWSGDLFPAAMSMVFLGASNSIACDSVFRDPQFPFNGRRELLRAVAFCGLFVWIVVAAGVALVTGSGTLAILIGASTSALVMVSHLVTYAMRPNNTLP